LFDEHGTAPSCPVQGEAASEAGVGFAVLRQDPQGQARL
jgi:hypothetical protein